MIPANFPGGARPVAGSGDAWFFDRRGKIPFPLDVTR
jgi:hypothetical protein